MKVLYKKIAKVYCPCLKDYVIFNSKGFHHLKYDGQNKMRNIKIQMYKLGLLPLAVPVIKTAKEIEKHQASRYLANIQKYAEDWAIKAVVGKQKTTVKVILRKIGNGNIFFLSIMKKRDKKR
jgi:hypothetical protein